MSEFRHDPLSRRWVIIGGERGGRPNEFVEAATRATDISCPFCAGHESETPPPIASYSSNGKGKWLVRVVPNKYPAVTSAERGTRNSEQLGSEFRVPRSALGSAPGFGS